MVRIVTDSAADFEPWELDQMNVACIPISVFFGKQEYQENISLTKDRFYNLLEQEEVFPHTSQPSPQAFISVLQEAKDSGDDAVVITLSSALSGTHQSAVLAKNILEYENCHVIDSLNATGGQRLLVEHAVKLRDTGKSADEIAAEIEALRPRVVLYACMDTIEYLHRGGRISHTAYKIGSIARVKPILHVDANGRAVIPAKALGIRKGMDFLCNRLEEKKPNEEYPLYVMFTGNRKNGEILAERIREMKYTVPYGRVINVGAAIGSHIGPNACGIVYIS